MSEVCRELGIRPSMVYRWQKEQAQYGNRSFPGKGHEKLTSAEAEIKALKKQLADREEELEILKKAITVMNRLKQ